MMAVTLYHIYTSAHCDTLISCALEIFLLTYLLTYLQVVALTKWSKLRQRWIDNVNDRTNRTVAKCSRFASKHSSDQNLIEECWCMK